MKSPLLLDFYWTYSIDRWEEKKLELQNLIDNTTLLEKDTSISLLSTDREISRNYTSKVIQIISSELQAFAESIDAKELEIVDCWTVQYKKGDYQSVHTHGGSSYTGCIYIDFDKNEHEGTKLVTNGIDSETNGTAIVSPDIKEGDIMIIPSNILHFVTPNRSDKLRTILAFDINKQL